MNTLAEGQDVNDPKVKTEVAEQVLPLIRDLPSAIERDTYIQQLARLLRVDERSLVGSQPTTPRRKPIRRRPGMQAEIETPTQEAAAGWMSSPEVGKAHMLERLEEHCLSFLMREPEMLYKINRALKEAELQPLAEEDFQNTVHQEFLKAVLQSVDQDTLNPVSFALDHIPFSLLEQAEAVLKKSESVSIDAEHLIPDLVRTILRMRETKLQSSNNQIRFLMEEAQEHNQDELIQYNYTIQKNSQTLLRIHKALVSSDLKSAKP